ncbi:hypothetical protein PR202_gb14859 [Eleusine coracana subsp. coracana]|uniref:Protein kinase domain-containing protein n=1 Tax=Eleusine coracana subsp. coracana TaxID=191504 RepID=A0AAV5EWH0_ELECO|nr:hypothetical protein PR202_gb14859 [Eleusine coracana subsp. coracana]
MSTARLLGILLMFMLLVSSSESFSDDVFALLAFKRAIFEDPLSRLSDWNARDKDPCKWSGVGCSPFNSRVVTIDLSNASLEGFLVPQIGSLRSLQKLKLDDNILMGSIPEEIGMLKNLTELDLGANQLTGPIPSEIGDMTKIKKIDLHGNRLNGAIPSELGKLANLVELRLSNNRLTGIIPASQNSQGTGNEDPAATNEKKGLPEPLWLLILEVFAAVTMLCFLTLCTVAGFRQCKARSSGSGTSVPWTRAVSWKENTVISIDDDLLGNVPKISRHELSEACEDFSNIIGSSHETVVYKGTLEDGPEIAVVSLSVSRHHWNNYVAEMARLSHENVAKMAGYCKESDPFSRMLVFQYPANGTLYEHLHDGEGCQLSWARRMKLAMGIARAVRYLHNELQPPFAVAALTSSSVYLTEDFSPKITDFERWRYLVTKPGLGFGGEANGGFVSSVTDSQHKRFMDVQANTFAFGARKHLDQPEEFSKLVDPKLQSVNQESLGIVCNVVNLCIDPEPSRRPSMSMIAAILEEGIEASAATLLRDSSLAWAEAELAIS